MNSHLKKYSHLFNQEGMDRGTRDLPALDPGSVAIDGRKLKDLLVYLQKFSKHIRFKEGDKKTGISWNDVLKKDIALLTADIASFRLQGIVGEYDLLKGQFDQHRVVPNFIRLLDPVYAAFFRLDEWYSAAVDEGSETKLKKDLQTYIQSYLSRKLADLHQIDWHAHGLLLGAHSWEGRFQELKNRDQVWGDPYLEDHAFGERIFVGKDEAEKLLNASFRLKEIFDSVFHVLSAVVGYCLTYLDERLSEKKDRQPHVGLLITFLKLYGYAQEEINKLPAKYLDYYYEQVLGIKPRAAQPDAVYVNFELENGFAPYEIKKGTRLLAGKDKLNKDLIYAIQRSITVNKAQVAALRNVYIEKDRHNQVLQYYTTDLAGPGIGGSLLGNRAGQAGVRMGFALASAQFNLTRGERNVTLQLELDKELLTEQFDNDILELRLTGEKGWLSSEKAADGIRIQSVGKTDERMLELNFTISISQASAIIPFLPALHEGNYITAQPVLECLLKYPSPPEQGEEALMSGYQNKIMQLNNLQKLRLLSAAITVQVGDPDASISFNGVRDLQLQNHEAILNPKKPFYPFTSIPKAGSSFYIGSQDLFCKPLQRLSLNMEWMLPDHFQSYYDKYLPPYDSNKFTASLSILRNKRWQKIRDVPIIDVDSKEPKWRSIKIDLNELPAENPEGGEGVSRFDASKPDGMLKLKLNHPDFGHGIYTQLITSSIMEKVSSKQANPDFYKMVKKQLHDSVISIKLPTDMENRNGPFSVVVFAIAEDLERSDEEARTMMIKGISGVIRTFNGDYMVDETPVGEAPGGEVREGGTRGGGAPIIVNDDNIIKRFIRLVRGIKPTTHYEGDKEELEDVADSINKKFEPVVSFILPSERELTDIIIKVTNSAIDQTVVKVVDELIAMRKTGISGQSVGAIFKKAFDESNKVINDMIAMKIATVLLANEVPPPPYTPQLNMLSVSYTSSRSCRDGEDQFFRIGPFGVAEIGEGDALFDEAVWKVPAARLFIGIRDAEPGQELCLLLNLTDGKSSTGQEPPAISWEYLAGNVWQKLPADCLVSDGTYGLQTTGIVEFSLPGTASNEGTLFDIPGLYWLCASVARDAESFPSLVGILSNAVVASFVDEGNDPQHGALPLEAGKITRLSDKLPAIKKVQQPMASFHGRVKECRQEYYTRVSERLRHKSRAVNSWDYERLVLEHFPEVFKVKCLNNYRDGRFARGHVTVLPICNLRNKENMGIDLLIPHASYIQLKAIEEFLSTRTSTFVRIHAINPLLSRVLIKCRVKFKPGVDKGGALQRLNKELIALLTPWARGVNEQPSFSAKLYAFNIISFIDKRDYVDYVDDLQMGQYIEDEVEGRVFCKNEQGDISLTETQFIAGHALLVSAPEHIIEWIG